MQDLYQNDCDDCHNRPIRCHSKQCQPYQDQDSKSLIALWTVKRIRHRDLHSGHRYELQFTVSPMSPAANVEFVTRNGNFDYNIPGHVFIIKIKNPSHSRNSFEKNEKYKIDTPSLPSPYYRPVSGDTFNAPTNTNEFIPNSINVNSGRFYNRAITNTRPETDPNHTGYLIGISNDYKLDGQPVPQHSHEQPFVTKDFYTKTHEKIQEPVKHYHHHFYIPEVSDIDIDSKPQHLTTNKNLPFITSVKPVLNSDSAQKFILTTGGVPNRQAVHQSTQRVPPITTENTYNFRTPIKYTDTTLPIQVQPVLFSTKYHSTFTPSHPTVYKIISIPTPTQPTPFHPSPYFIQYSEPDPIYTNNEPPTVAGYITQSLNAAIEPTRTTFTTNLKPEILELSTIPTTTSSNKKSNKYPDSINAQLPPPKNNADTTIPYVSSTIVAIVSKPSDIHDHSESAALVSKLQVIKPNQEMATIPIEKSTISFEKTITPVEKTTIPLERLTFPIEKTTFPVETITFGKTTIPIDKLTFLTTNRQESQTEYIATTPITTIVKPTNSKITESATTDIQTHKYTEITTIAPTTNDVPTTILSTTKRYFGRPYKYRPSYIDDFDIFADNKTQTTTKTITTTESDDELFNRQITTVPTTTVTLKNTRLSKYLKYKRNRGNNRYNKYKNYNSERLRNRLNATRHHDFLKTGLSDDDVETKTSQSLITSISFKVNRNGRHYNDFARPAIIPSNTEKPKVRHNYKQEKDFNLFKDLPETTTSRANTKAFNDIAQTLVNHARAVSYLDTKTTYPTTQRTTYPTTQHSTYPTTTNSHK